MEYRLLGRTGLSVSRMCFGTLTFTQANVPPEEATEVLREAYRLGVNFIDTAQFYNNYEHLRAFLRGAPDVVVTSKTYAYEADAAKQAVEDARRRLDRDYIDIFLLHEQESEHTLRGHSAALEMLYTLKAQGILRAVGLSTHHVAALRAATAQKLDVVHPLINVDGFGIADGTREDMERALVEAHISGLGLYGMKALGGGNLFRKAPECLAYALALPTLDSVAIGMRSIEEVRGNVTFWETGTYPPEQLNSIVNRERRLQIEPWCEGCSQCVIICKAGALSIFEGKIACDAAKCVLCGYCGQVCRNFCLKIV